jgi:hypothetical protein
VSASRLAIENAGNSRQHVKHLGAFARAQDVIHRFLLRLDMSARAGEQTRSRWRQPKAIIAPVIRTSRPADETALVQSRHRQR